MRSPVRYLRPSAATLAVVGLLAVVLLAVPAWLIVADRRSQAAFSASSPLGDNRLTAATAELTVGRTTATFSADNLLPGDRHRLRLDLSNAGTVPLVVSVDVIPEAGFDGLAQVLDLNLVRTESCDPGTTDRLLGVGDSGDIHLAVGEAATVCLVAELPLTAPNRVQGETSRYTVVLNGTHDFDGQ